MAAPDRPNFLAVEIETERLKLVPLSMQWKMDCFREFNADITTYMQWGPPKDPSVVEENIKKSLDELKNGVGLHLVILKKDTDEFLGRVGIEESNTRHPEIGLWLKKSAHGKGYGREAAAAVKQWADEQMDYEYIVYPVDRDNIQSRKIPELLGGKVHESYDKKTNDGRTLHTVVYRIDAPTHGQRSH
jgi:RimJ/RimL family protein N-acetyltransferase